MPPFSSSSEYTGPPFDTNSVTAVYSRPYQSQAASNPLHRYTGLSTRMPDSARPTPTRDTRNGAFSFAHGPRFQAHGGTRFSPAPAPASGGPLRQHVRDGSLSPAPRAACSPRASHVSGRPPPAASAASRHRSGRDTRLPHRE